MASASLSSSSTTLLHDGVSRQLSVVAHTDGPVPAYPLYWVPATCNLLSTPLGQALLEAVKAEGRGCGDVGRLAAVVEALARLAGCGGCLRPAALSGLMVLLCSRLPQVRTKPLGCWPAGQSAPSALLERLPESKR